MSEGFDTPPEEMDDPTLARAWQITNEGRQYKGVEEDRRAIGAEMADRLFDRSPGGFDAYVNGEPVIIRGAERSVEESQRGNTYVDIRLAVDFVADPLKETRTVNISTVRCDGGIAALTDHLVERGLVPEWWAETKPVPDNLD